MRKFFLILMVLTAQLTFANEHEQTDDDTWHFDITHYIWAMGTDGDVTIRGVESDSDTDFCDIMDDFKFNINLHYELQRKRFGLFGDTSILWLEDEADTLIGETDVDSELGIFDLGAMYSIIRRPDDDMKVDLLAGVRYFRVKTDIEFDNGIDFDGSQDWFDPFIGSRLFTRFNENWVFNIQSDIGGFSLGSDFTWNLNTMLGYEFNDTYSLWLGYRWLDIDIDKGDSFKYDATISGPTLVSVFRF